MDAALWRGNSVYRRHDILPCKTPEVYAHDLASVCHTRGCSILFLYFLLCFQIRKNNLLTNQHLFGKIYLLIFQQVFYLEENGMIGRFETFTFALSELSASWNKIASDEMKKFDLKANYVLYLIALYKYPDGLTSANLCEMCNKDKAEVSRAIALMEKKGLIKRTNVTVNGYRAKITLTEQGRASTMLLRERVKLAVEKGGRGLTDGQREIFYEVLAIISANLKEISKEGL